MASIKKYDTAKGTAWRVQYRSPDGRSRTKQGFRTKTEAQAWADKNAVAIREQDWINPHLGKTTITELVEKWFAISEHKPSWRTRLEKTWEVHVKPHWEHRTVASITQLEVRTWLGELKTHPRGKQKNFTPQPLSGSSKRHCLTILAGALDIAVQEKMIRENPARGFDLPKKAKARKIFLTATQLTQLAGESSHPDIILTLGVTGLRWGELAGLQVRDINLEKNTLTIERNAVWIDGKTTVGTPKSGAARVVVTPPFITEILKSRAAGKAPTAWVFSDSDLPINRPHSANHWFQQAVARSVEEGIIPERITLHDLRHTAASLMVASGANIKAIQRQLGHASAAMTLDVYAELFDEDLQGLGRRLHEAFSNVV